MKIGREACSPGAARASAPPIAEPPMPATTSPAVVSQSCMIADSTRHTASRRRSGSARTSPSWSEGSTWAMLARESSCAAAAAVAPSLIRCSPPSLLGCYGHRHRSAFAFFGSPRSASLELDRAVGQLDTGEDTRPVGDHVVRPHPHPLAEHRPAGDPGAGPDATAGRDDAVAQLAAVADL